MLTHFDIVTLQPGQSIKGFALSNQLREIVSVQQCGQTHDGKTFAFITADHGGGATINGCVREGDDMEIWQDWQVAELYNEERNLAVLPAGPFASAN